MQTEPLSGSDRCVATTLTIAGSWSTVSRSDVQDTTYYPLAFEPRENAGKALSNTIAEWQVAWPFTPTLARLVRPGRSLRICIARRACPSVLLTGRGADPERASQGPRHLTPGRLRTSQGRTR